MNWLLPAFLGAGALIGLPVLLHLLRRKPQIRIPFPSLQFLGPSALQETRKHRILRWIVLILRCLAVLALAAGFARPFFGERINPHGRGVIVAIDNSFSMQAAGRWETLGQWVETRLDTLVEGDQAGLLLMHPSPRWLVKMTPDLSAVRSALRDAEPGYETTRYRPALLMAGEVLKSLPVARRELIWMADEQRIGWTGIDFSQTLPPGVMLTLPPEQTEITRQSSVTIGRIQRSSVELKFRNFSNGNDARTLTLFVDDQKTGEFPVTIPAGSSDSRIFPIPSGQRIRASLDPDDLTVDDTVYGIGDTTHGQTVLLAPADESGFLTHAIASTQSLPNPLRVAPLPEGKWPAGAVAVLRGETAFQAPYLAAFEEFTTNGGNVWIFVNGSTAQKNWLEKRGITIEPRSEPGQPRNWDVTHPILTPFAEGQALQSLLELRFRKGWALTGLEPLAQWSDGSIAAGVLETGNSRLFLTGFDVSRADGSFPLKTAFVPFVHQALIWLGGNEQETGNFRVGQSIQLPAGAGKLSVEGKPPIEISGSFTPTRPGIYQFFQASEVKQFAVNVAEDESDLAPWPEPADFARLQSLESAKNPAPSPAPATFAGAESGQRSSLWWWLLAAAVLFFIAETGLSNRTIP